LHEKYTPISAVDEVWEMWQSLRLVTRALREKAVLRKQPEEIAAIQQQRLRSLTAWAKERSPYHAERLRHVNPDRFELSDVPALTKPEMMRNFDRLVTDRQLRLAELEEFVREPARLGRWYLGEFAPSRTSGTQGLEAMIVQDRGCRRTNASSSPGESYKSTQNSVWYATHRKVRLAMPAGHNEAIVHGGTRLGR
jgi:hypothetical protein